MTSIAYFRSPNLYAGAGISLFCTRTVVALYPEQSPGSSWPLGICSGEKLLAGESNSSFAFVLSMLKNASHFTSGLPKILHGAVLLYKGNHFMNTK
jgi:hypothetical protein